MTQHIPDNILDMLERADHSWRSVLQAGLEAVAQKDPAYLTELAADNYLPTEGRLFAAFTQPLNQVKYVLVGEGPYPRPDSATGFCFMDGAVHALWSENGLSKQVNRATSLRNFMKMLLVTAEHLSIEQTTGEAMAKVALKTRAIGSPFIQTLAEMQQNLMQQGFLLLNAALVFRPHVPPLKEAKAWQPFLQVIFAGLADHAAADGATPPTLVLWGKVAEQLNALPAIAHFPKAMSEHPYNISFIGNQSMQAFFAPMHLLLRQEICNQV